MGQLIVRKLEDWETFFLGLNKLQKEHKEIITRTIRIIEMLKDNYLPKIEEERELLNLIVELQINNFEEILILLKTLNSFYSFERLIEEIKELKDKYDINYLGFQTTTKVVIEEYYTPHKFIKVYRPLNIVAERCFDLTRNSVSSVIIKGDKAFIIDKKDLDNRHSEFNQRILCTRDFRLNTSLLPKKEEMNILNIEEERKQLFRQLLYFLGNYSSDVTLIIDDPNQIYMQDKEIRSNYFTISSDGNLSDGNQELYPRYSGYLTSNNIVISRANFAVISEIDKAGVKKIYLIVKKEFLEAFQNSEDLEKILNSLKRETVNIRTLMINNG